MAFLLPHLAFAPAQCRLTYCAPRHLAPRPSFASFLSVVDDALNEVHRESQRETKRQIHRQSFNPRFDIRERGEGYEIEAEVPGFENRNIDVEVTDEHTLRVRGNTEQEAGRVPYEPIAEQASSVDLKRLDVDQPGSTKESQEAEIESMKSHQATVEDDFEDLGAETSSTISGASTPLSSFKAKEEAVESIKPVTAETSIQQELPPQKQQQSRHREWLSERTHGSFERTFRFPSRINGGNVRAQLKNGVLYIAVPKAPVPEVRHVAIQ